MVSFYHLNNKSFTELFCENQDKPEMECNGKCYLTEVSNDNQQEKNDSLLNNFQKEIAFFLNLSEISNEPSLTETVYFPEYFYFETYKFSFVQNCLRPPEQVS